MALGLFQAEDGIRDDLVTGVQTCAVPIERAVAGGGDRQRDVIARQVGGALEARGVEVTGRALTGRHVHRAVGLERRDRQSTRLNSRHQTTPSAAFSVPKATPYSHHTACRRTPTPPAPPS